MKPQFGLFSTIPKWNSGQRQGIDQSGYYSEDSEFNSVSMTSVTTSKASTARKGWNRDQQGTFDHRLNQKITFSKLNDDTSTICGYGWLMPTDMLILDAPWMPWRMRSIGVSQMDFGEYGFIRTVCWGTAC